MVGHTDLNQNLIDTSTKVPYDARFANHNTMKGCWLSYIEFHNCWAANKDNPGACTKRKASVTNRCARQEVAHWDKLRWKAQFGGLNPKYQGENAPDYDEDALE